MGKRQPHYLHTQQYTWSAFDMYVKWIEQQKAKQALSSHDCMFVAPRCDLPNTTCMEFTATEKISTRFMVLLSPGVAGHAAPPVHLSRKHKRKQLADELKSKHWKARVDFMLRSRWAPFVPKTNVPYLQCKRGRGHAGLQVRLGQRATLLANAAPVFLYKYWHVFRRSNLIND